MVKTNLSVLFVLLIYCGTIGAKYEPNWDSLDTRPLPTWYDNAKVGIFLHWGVFSVPSFGSEWFWNRWKNGSQEYVDYINNNFPPEWSYQEFARDFTAELFNPTEWAKLFEKSGAKYVVLTSKHHEGYTLWPSKYSFSWNAKDIGPHRDLVGDLAEAVRTHTNLKFGLYHSLYEWFNPTFLADKENNFKTQNYSLNKVLPEMYELINAYKPAVIWSDGSGGAKDTYWKATEFLAWLYNESPVKDEIVANDRWGAGTNCHHGDFYTCHDRYDPGTLQEKKWENALTLDKHSWGYRRNAKLDDYLTPLELLTKLARTVSCGGNILINVGPTKDGIITPIYEERLTQLGQWLNINGEAIYESQPWTVQNDTLNGNVWYTTRDNAVYAIDLEWPKDDTVILGSVNELFKSTDTVVTLLGNSGKLKWLLNNNQVEIQLPKRSSVKSETAWVLKISS